MEFRGVSLCRSWHSMNLIVAALRHPWTVMVVVLAVALASFMAVGPAVFQQFGLPYLEGLPKGMEVDIFPALNLPVIYVCQPYGGIRSWCFFWAASGKTAIWESR